MILPLISITNLLLVLSDINFELYPGKTLAIVGKSGSGKSTLAKLILGLYKPTRGIFFCFEKKLIPKEG